MYHNEVYTDVNMALPGLLTGLMSSRADEVGSRAGRTRELTHVGVTLEEPLQREILLPDRKANIAAQIAETMWVLSGRNGVEWLANYLPRATTFSDDGETWRAGYGQRLRRFSEAGGEDGVDQLAYVYNTLKRDPASRQAVMSIWDPSIDTYPGKDIPCNDWLHFLSRNGYLDLHVAIRSNDIVWGWSGINQFEWSALLEVMAGMLGMKVGSLHFSITSLHIYDRHWDKAEKILASARYTEVPVKGSPRFDKVHSLEYFDELCKRWFQLEYDIRTGSPLVQGYIEEFPEPMMQSWLRVLQWWWSFGDREYLLPIEFTPLELATRAALQPKRPEVKITLDDQMTPKLQEAQDAVFIEYVVQLHNQKHAAYGDSWKRRGEMLGIMANIARKIDRLGGGGTEDETSADTAIDLFVYLAKYRVWLDARASGTPHDFDPSDFTNAPNEIMRRVADHERTSGASSVTAEYLKKTFDELEIAVTCNSGFRREVVDRMLPAAFVLARHLWNNERDEYRGADHD